MYRYTKNFAGAAYGWASTPSQFLIPGFRKPAFVQGLRLVGHWSTVAQGIPGVIYNGFETARAVSTGKKIIVRYRIRWLRINYFTESFGQSIIDIVASGTDNMKKSQFIDENLATLSQFWLSRSALIGAVVFLLLGIMDRFATPENFPRFFLYRALIAVSLLGIYYLNKQRKSIAYQNALLLVGVASSAMIIELMVLSFGGHKSNVGQRAYSADSWSDRVKVQVRVM